MLIAVEAVHVQLTGEHREVVHTKAELGRVGRLHLKTLELIPFDERRFAPRRERRGDMPIIAGVVVEDRAVSYTHLDVYKRQLSLQRQFIAR